MRLQILAFTGDNASSNDTQTTCLAAMENSFVTSNRVRCYNHILNLVAKALLRPFSHKLTIGGDDGSLSETQSIPDLEEISTDLDAEEENMDRIVEDDIDDNDTDFIDYQWTQFDQDLDQVEAVGNVKSAIDKVPKFLAVFDMSLTK